MRSRLAAGAVGVLLILGGVYQLLVDAQRTHPVYLVMFVIGLAVLDDVVLIPLLLLVGWLTVRFLPRPAVRPVQVGLVVFGGAFVVGLVFALSPERGGDAGTLLTQPYGRNLALIAGAIALVAALTVVFRVAGVRRLDGARR